MWGNGVWGLGCEESVMWECVGVWGCMIEGGVGVWGCVVEGGMGVWGCVVEGGMGVWECGAV